MRHILGEDWRDIFDIIIVQARKPRFFTDTNRPFRLYDFEAQTPVWDKVRHLEKGKVYCEVTVIERFTELRSVNRFILAGNRKTAA